MRIVVSGYYGFGNAGDEAVLQGLLASLREAAGDEALHVTVLSGDPAATAAQHGVEAVPRQHAGAVRGALRRADLLISGGGGLLQDRTSARSPLYYLGVIAMARALRVPVYLYGQGVGPIRRPWLQRVAAMCLKSVAGAGVRDEASARRLLELGVPRERIAVTADAAFALAPPGAAAREAARNRLGPADRRLIGVVWRSPWVEEGVGESGRHTVRRGVAEAVARFAQAHGGSVVVFPFHPEMDEEDAVRFAGEVAAEGADAVRWPGDAAMSFAGEPAAPAGPWMTLLAAVDVALCVRFHGLVFAAMAGVPAVALAYDPKVRHLAEDLGVPWFAPGAGPEAIREALEQVWAEREAVSRKLSARAAELRTRARAEGKRAIELARKARC